MIYYCNVTLVDPTYVFPFVLIFLSVASLRSLILPLAGSRYSIAAQLFTLSVEQILRQIDEGSSDPGTYETPNTSTRGCGQGGEHP